MTNDHLELLVKEFGKLLEEFPQFATMKYSNTKTYKKRHLELRAELKKRKMVGRKKKQAQGEI
jgi:hypothetical protein